MADAGAAGFITPPGGGKPAGLGRQAAGEAGDRAGRT